MSISEVKSTAKKTLTGKFKNVYGTMLLYTLINFSLEYISELILLKNNVMATILSIVFSIIQILFGYGLISNLIKISKQPDPIPYTQFITDAVLNIVKVVKIIFKIFLKMLLPTILFSIILYIEIYFQELSKTNNSYVILSIVFFIILFCSAIFLISYGMNFVFSLFCLVDNNDKSINELISKSKSLIKGNKLKYIFLVFSFIGYLILIILFTSIFAYFVEPFLVKVIIKILTMFLTPYLTISQYIFYEELLPITNE